MRPKGGSRPRRPQGRLKSTQRETLLKKSLTLRVGKTGLASTELREFVVDESSSAAANVPGAEGTEGCPMIFPQFI